MNFEKNAQQIADLKADTTLNPKTIENGIHIIQILDQLGTDQFIYGFLENVTSEFVIIMENGEKCAEININDTHAFYVGSIDLVPKIDGKGKEADLRKLVEWLAS
jgi:hypothetical protein